MYFQRSYSIQKIFLYKALPTAFDIELKRKCAFQDGVILRLEVCKEEDG
jgi:hypothetical protein